VSTGMFAECKNHFLSVERALTYSKVEQEAAAVLPADAALAASGWPFEGQIAFSDVKMCYRPGLPLVLAGVSMVIEGGQKTAVVGRTGAGKSSLSVALLRLSELDDGAITIDGQNIRGLGLAVLRRSITMIQQDAILFAGTVRTNLDPLSEHADSMLEAALETVEFSRHMGASAGINTNVADAGSNLSAGTRQLLGVAAASLRRSKIVLLDEATANCDFATDATIQRVIRASFSGATMLCIAHRLETIIDYDSVIVMQHGVAAEHGAPAELLDDSSSLFSALVRDTGKQAAQSLRASASTALACARLKTKSCLKVGPDATSELDGVPRVTSSENV